MASADRGPTAQVQNAYGLVVALLTDRSLGINGVTKVGDGLLVGLFPDAPPDAQPRIEALLEAAGLAAVVSFGRSMPM